MIHKIPSNLIPDDLRRAFDLIPDAVADRIEAYFFDHIASFPSRFEDAGEKSIYAHMAALYNAQPFGYPTFDPVLNPREAYEVTSVSCSDDALTILFDFIMDCAYEGVPVPRFNPPPLTPEALSTDMLSDAFDRVMDSFACEHYGSAAIVAFYDLDDDYLADFGISFDR